MRLQSRAICAHLSLSIPGALVEMLAAYLQAIGFTAAELTPRHMSSPRPDGHPLNYTSRRQRVWVPTVAADWRAWGCRTCAEQTPRSS